MAVIPRGTDTQSTNGWKSGVAGGGGGGGGRDALTLSEIKPLWQRWRKNTTTTTAAVRKKTHARSRSVLRVRALPCFRRVRITLRVPYRVTPRPTLRHRRHPLPPPPLLLSLLPLYLLLLPLYLLLPPAAESSASTARR